MILLGWQTTSPAVQEAWQQLVFIVGGEAPSVVVRVPGPEDVMDMLEFAEKLTGVRQDEVLPSSVV